ncbi:acetate/propionate family kinase [bacterium]|nr:acetate/propionate family kinase [bacterium]
MILVLNAGSSTLKHALFAPPALHRAASGTIERIAAGAHVARLPELFAALGAAPLTAIGHRVVHGGERFSAPVRVDAEVLAALRQLAPLAPEHAPQEIALIAALAAQRPDVPQVACFDTAFHADLPAAARLLPIPRHYAAQGVRRYGFHGLSYAYLRDELARLDPAAARGRVVFAHLGNGCSLAAVRDGRCVDTTMAFTPAAGLVMGTRSGDLDPGLVAYLARREGLDAAAFDALVNGRSGLLGLSQTSGDVRDLLAAEAHDARAAEALAVFCLSARKWIGAMAASLDGLDTLVFSAGIGAHAAPIRARICAGLTHLGVRLDGERNAAHAAVISAPGSAVTVRVIPTDEERQIARETAALLAA